MNWKSKLLAFLHAKAKRIRVRAGKLISARLAAARIPKPVVLTGWTEAVHLKGTTLRQEHGAKSTPSRRPRRRGLLLRSQNRRRRAEACQRHQLAWRNQRQGDQKAPQHAAGRKRLRPPRVRCWEFLA